MVNLELKIDRNASFPQEINPMQLIRYFDPNLTKITNIKEVKNNVGAPTGKYAVFFKDSTEASNFVHRYDNDYINTAEVSIPLKAYVYQLRKSGESQSEIAQRY